MKIADDLSNFRYCPIFDNMKVIASLLESACGIDSEKISESVSRNDSDIGDDSWRR
jgi:hypothetical protein